MTQSALYSLCKTAARENENINVRFDEVYLGFQVERDDEAVEHGFMKSSEF